MSNKTQPARGMRDFLPSDVRKRNYVIGIIKEVYESYGFEPLETPAVENLETLTGKYGEEGGQLMFKILKRGEKLDVNDKQLADLALRYDLTVPLARVVANYKNELPKFFKRYQIQPVWRADRPARGRFREFYQCDVDAIGSSSMMVEVELISTVCEILEKLGFQDFTVRINDRKLLSEILNKFGISEDKHTDALIAIDKLDKIGIDGVSEELESRGIQTEKGDDLIKFFRDSSKNYEQLKNYSILASSVMALLSQGQMTPLETSCQFINESLVENLNELLDSESLIRGLGDTEKILTLYNEGNNKSSKVLVLDPSLARGLAYYTGAIFEIRLEGGDFSGSLGGGGRYDGLIGMFGKEQIPACGFSLGLERILVVMEERGMFDKLIAEGKLKADSADVMIACFDEQLVGECLKLANELRQKDLRVLVFPEANQKVKPIKYAEQIKVPFVCLLKETELAENKVTLKNLLTGEQEIVAREDVAAKIAQRD